MSAMHPLYSSVRARIFVSDMGPPTNIWGRSNSNQTVHIFVGFRPKPANITLNSSVSEPTNE
jgi:hypothetical protein